MSDTELKVYVKPGCPWCIGVTSYLHNEDYEFTEIDVLSSDKAFTEMQELSGQTFAPTLVYGDEVLADCDVNDVKKFLRHLGVRPAGES